MRMVLDNEVMVVLVLVLEMSTEDDDHREANPVVALRGIPRDPAQRVEVWEEMFVQRPLVAGMVVQIQGRRAQLQVEVGC